MEEEEEEEGVGYWTEWPSKSAAPQTANNNFKLTMHFNKIWGKTWGEAEHKNTVQHNPYCTLIMYTSCEEEKSCYFVVVNNVLTATILSLVIMESIVNYSWSVFTQKAQLVQTWRHTQRTSLVLLRGMKEERLFCSEEQFVSLLFQKLFPIKEGTSTVRWFKKEKERIDGMVESGWA